MAQDLALFVLFFDLMLLPFLFLTGIWGPGTRVAAITKLFIYTLVGSLLMLAAAIATGVLVSQQTGNDLSLRLQRPGHEVALLPKGSQEWIFLCFAAAFWVKMPAFPVHGWMPDGYRNMPLPVLAVFSAVLSKVAAYGFLRVVLPLFPDAIGALPGPDAACWRWARSSTARRWRSRRLSRGSCSGTRRSPSWASSRSGSSR